MEMQEFFGLIREQVELEKRNHPNETYNKTWIETDFVRMYPGLVIPYLVILGITTLSGSVGNILVMGAVVVHDRLRTTGNMFIVNLALADIFVTSMVFPFCIVGVVLGPEYFVDKETLCYVIAGVCLTACVCSLWNMGGIALNRYIFLCHNYLYDRMYTKRSTILMCLGLWVAAALLMELPIALGWGGHTYDIKTMMCIWNRMSDYSFSVFVSVVAVGSPMVLVFMFYLRIYLFVHASQKRLAQFSTKESVKGKKSDKSKETHMEKLLKIRKKEEIQLARTLFIVFFVYFTCWAPYGIVNIFDRYDQFPMIVHVVGTVMAHTNSSLNSVIYAATNKQFRDGYKKFLGLVCGCCRVDRLYRSFSSTQLTSSASVSTDSLVARNTQQASQRF